jgi:hypothetical protein
MRLAPAVVMALYLGLSEEVRDILIMQIAPIFFPA